MEKMSDRCHFPSGDPIHTKPMEHALCMKAGPSTLAKASGDLQSRLDRGLDPLHMDQEDLFWLQHRDGPHQIRKRRYSHSTRNLRLTESNHIARLPQIT